jgi:hypothetical protein
MPLWKDAMALPMYTPEPEVVISDDTHLIDYHQLQALQQETDWAQDRYWIYNSPWPGVTWC